MIRLFKSTWHRFLAPILHDRMPVIFNPEQAKVWLQKKANQKELTNLLTPINAKNIIAHEVSDRVNIIKNNDARLIRSLHNDLIF